MKREDQPAKVLLFAALALAQRARAAAAIFARAAGLILRRPFAPPLRYLAQRNLCAAAIFARAEALIFRRPPRLPEGAEGDPPSTDSSSLSSRCILSRMTTARFNCRTDMLDKLLAISYD